MKPDYRGDKKRREEANRKKQEEKRNRRLNKSKNLRESGTETNPLQATPQA